jgi:hypothetical protein
VRGTDIGERFRDGAGAPAQPPVGGLLDPLTHASHSFLVRD